jgi:hypothetical protein
MGNDPCIGLTDKLYWRRSRHTGKWHCYTPADNRRKLSWEALCHPDIMLTRSGGQACARPPIAQRCAECNDLEMSRRSWSKPGPVSEDWKERG